MAKRVAKSQFATAWIEQLDSGKIDAAREEATLDAYDDYEQHTGCMTALGDERVFPLKTKGGAGATAAFPCRRNEVRVLPANRADGRESAWRPGS